LKGIEAMNLFKNHHGMNIVGQGGKIILFMLPSLIASMIVHTRYPGFAALPEGAAFLKYAGYAVMFAGLIFWGTAVIQLMTGFPKGRLVTNGAYGVVRNPIYASAVFLLLPAAALITLSWVYLVPSAFLYAGVVIFIGPEEKKLTEAFGSEYIGYMATVDRLVPFRKPVKRRVPAS
jgi:protein-S-isoprenylcysteine O-methyltransferase Ste14